MKATQILVEEHAVIKNILEVLEKIVSQAEEKRKLKAEDAATAIDFIKNFADGCHHSKEEERLFPEMEAHGFPRDGGPTGVMISEHEQGRAYVKGMTDSLEEASQGTSEGLKNFAFNARGYIQLLRQHIDKENQCLFTMADQSIPVSDAEALLRDFKEIEKKAGGKRHEHYFAIAQKLCENYGVSFVGDEEVKTIREELI